MKEEVEVKVEVMETSSVHLRVFRCEPCGPYFCVCLLLYGVDVRGQQ